jgi:3-dehydro-L-gulonate-6-phosphate decarboxylase
MKTLPMIQLALDYVTLPPAMAVAQWVHQEVDILEIGTPLTKAEGMRAVAAIRELCPKNLILADVKSPDVGGLEAKLCFDAGADWMTVMGVAPAETIRLALAEARSRPGKEIVVELTGIRDIMSYAPEWRSYGVERLCYHRGWDEGNLSRTWDAHDQDCIQALTQMGFKVSVAGGLGLDMIPFFQGLDLSVFVIGRAIHDTPDPMAAARQFRAAIQHYWGEAAEPHLAAEPVP